MQTLLQQPAFQERTLRLFGELSVIHEDWSGKLVIGAGEGCSTSGLASACSLAGGASLLLEPNPAAAKVVLRDGGIDFLVSTVEEALRTLKNEIRKGRPLAVVVPGDVPVALVELMDRGVAPELIFVPTSVNFAADNAWAAVQLLIADEAAPTQELESFLEARGLRQHTWQLPGRAAVRALDHALLELVDEEDVLRRRWLEGIARYQRSADQDHRTCWVTESELDRIADFWFGQGL